MLLDDKDGSAVDLPEWLFPPALAQEDLAKEAGLELKEHLNFHEFFAKYGGTKKNPDDLLYNMNVLGFDGSVSQEEFDISHMYCTLR